MHGARHPVPEEALPDKARRPRREEEATLFSEAIPRPGAEQALCHA